MSSYKPSYSASFVAYIELETNTIFSKGIKTKKFVAYLDNLSQGINDFLIFSLICCVVISEKMLS